jgi:predicted GNAT family acetyltransferase
MQVGLLADEQVPAARAFLEAHADTTLILLTSLMAHGTRLGEARNSGNFRCIRSEGEIRAVFVLNRRGNLLVEAAGRTDFTARIAAACLGEPVAIRGVLGEWRAASAVWEHLCAEHGYVEHFGSREWLYRLELARAFRLDAAPEVRCLRPEEFELWEPINTAFMAEAGMTLRATLDERRAAFEPDARGQRFFGGFAGERLVAVAHLNALHGSHGQIGGVYTVPEHRCRGFGRAVMSRVARESAWVHGLTRLVLFTGEQNRPAQQLYESLGFVRVGEFALFFGEPPA